MEHQGFSKEVISKSFQLYNMISTIHVQVGNSNPAQGPFSRGNIMIFSRTSQTHLNKENHFGNRSQLA